MNLSELIYIEKSFKIPTGQPESTNEEGKASQWPNEKRQMDKQRSTKHHT